jgi:salicylate synthetase/mycobactin phenyloxazoline synthetase
VYEEPDGVSFAEGAASTHSISTREGLLTIAAAMSAVAIKDWRAYGWATFELSYSLHGLDVSDDADHVCLMIPDREVRLERGSALLRALSATGLAELEERISPVPGGVPDRSGSEVGAREVDIAVREHDADRYRSAVAAAVAEIRGGRLDKVILSRVVPVSQDIDLPATYLAGRKANTPARSFLLRLGGWEVAGFSPEIVVRVDGDGEVVTQPLAGTRALVGDDDEDAARRAELYRDAKEVFEHAISVRLAAEELSEVCIPASVRVSEFMTVKERGSVQHLASELSGMLAPGRTPWDAFGVLFPAVTASGIPKAEAGELIRSIEPTPRGLYSGAVLTFDSTGVLDAALVLRSVFRRDGRTWLQAGAGVVSRSSPERELEETREKLRCVSRHLVPARAPMRATG